ncbi:MAG: BACON domain-containing protein [Bacteroidales bacterium]|nr:BACON domain-containing protein [Bacteroidales bacterium]
MHLKRAIVLLCAMSVLLCCNKQHKGTYLDICADEAGLAFEQGGGIRQLRIASSREWNVCSQPDWLVLDFLRGSGTPQTLSLQVNPNRGKARTGEVVFSNQDTEVLVTVTQKGMDLPVEEAGTLANPFSVAGFLSYIREHGNTESPEALYVTGIVVAVETAFSAGNGYAAFYLADTEENGAERFYCSHAAYLGNTSWVTGNTDIRQGDAVVFCGGTDGSGYLYSLNGKTDDIGGDVSSDYAHAPAATIAAFIAAARTDAYYKLTGTVSSLNTDTFEMTLTDETGSIYVYSVVNMAEWTGKVYDNGTITLSGKYHYYAGKRIDEVVDAYILSFVPAGSAKAPLPVTAAEFKAAPVSDDQPYRLSGKVSNIENTIYGNIDLTDETGTVYVYGLTASNLGYGNANDKSFATLGLALGDEIVIVGFRADYNGQAEAKYSYFVEKTGSSPPGGNEPPGDDPAGEPTMTADFRKPLPELPQSSSAALADGTYTWDTYPFTLHATEKFYQGQNGDTYYLLLGKQYAYIQLPVLPGKALKGIRFLTAPQASENIIIDIATTNGVRLMVNDNKLRKGTEYFWSIPGEVGMAYEILLTNKYNAQFQYISLFYE